MSDPAKVVESRSYPPWLPLAKRESLAYLNYVDTVGTMLPSKMPRKTGYKSVFFHNRVGALGNQTGVMASRFHHGGGLEHDAARRDPYGMLDSAPKDMTGWRPVDVSRVTQGNPGRLAQM